MPKSPKNVYYSKWFNKFNNLQHNNYNYRIISHTFLIEYRWDILVANYKSISQVNMPLILHKLIIYCRAWLLKLLYINIYLFSLLYTYFRSIWYEPNIFTNPWQKQKNAALLIPKSIGFTLSLRSKNQSLFFFWTFVIGNNISTYCFLFLDIIPVIVGHCWL